MPFLEEIVQSINQTLKGGSLKNKKLQPANFLGLSTVVARKKDAAQKTAEFFPAIVGINGKIDPIAPDSKYALQVYHKLLQNVYSFEKKSYGDGHFIKCASSMEMVVLTNSKITGIDKTKVEPVVLFGLPQRPGVALLAELKISHCLITPVSSNMDHTAVFRQEYPQNTYFLNDQQSIFSIKYKIEMSFDQACVDQCLCE